MQHHRIVVIGGGNAGLSIAGRLRRGGVDDIVVIEPRTHHVYAPLQSHIAGGRARWSAAVRPQRQVTPRGVTWLQDAVSGVDPGQRRVRLESGEQLAYDQLVVCPGIQNEWNAVSGLEAAMQTSAGVSNYDLPLAAKASPALRDLQHGTAVFVQADGPTSCPGAAQKPMYLAADWWRSQHRAVRMLFVTAASTPTGIGSTDAAPIDAELRAVMRRYGIEARYDTVLEGVDADRGELRLRGPEGEIETVAYDLLHAQPPQRAAEWIAASGLADDHGFVDVDPETLRHRRFADVWAIGDAAEAGVSRSGGALRKQTKAAAQNIIAVLRGAVPSARYAGYSVCPYTVSRRSVMFVEFDREGRLQPTVPGWRTLYREKRLAWLFDRYVLPWVYWHLITQGRA